MIFNLATIEDNPLTPFQQVSLVRELWVYLVGAKRSCSRDTIHRVTKAIGAKSHKLIGHSCSEEEQESAKKLYMTFGIPNIALGVDGTQIRLGNKPRASDMPTALHPQYFWCRKQYYSLNCQVIGDANFVFFQPPNQKLGTILKTS